MDERIKQIIESGLMKKYLLGQCSEKQTQEIDELLENSEELQNYIQEIGDSSDATSSTIIKEPTLEIREDINEEIKKSDESLAFYKKHIEDKKTSMSFVSVVLIAVTICMFIGLFTAFSLFMKNIELQKSIDKTSHLLKEHDSYSKELDMHIDLLQLKMNKIQEQLSIVNNGQTNKVILRGHTTIGELNIVVYWNKEQKASVFSIEELPKLPESQCFQFWADVNGAKISLGVIKKQDFIQDLEFVEKAKRLSVTIEPEGGSLYPTESMLISSSVI